MRSHENYTFLRSYREISTCVLQKVYFSWDLMRKKVDFLRYQVEIHTISYFEGKFYFALRLDGHIKKVIAQNHRNLMIVLKD